MYGPTWITLSDETDIVPELTEVPESESDPVPEESEDELLLLLELELVFELIVIVVRLFPSVLILFIILSERLFI